MHFHLASLLCERTGTMWGASELSLPLGHLARLQFLCVCIAERACVCVCVCVCVRVQYLCILVGEGFYCLYHTHKYKETHIFLPKRSTDIKLSVSFSGVLSFHSGLIWCLSRKSNQLHIQLDLDLLFNLPFFSCIYCTRKKIHIYLLSFHLQSYPALQWVRVGNLLFSPPATVAGWWILKSTSHWIALCSQWIR